jgi:hypothetical protein
LEQVVDIFEFLGIEPVQLVVIIGGAVAIYMKIRSTLEMIGLVQKQHSDWIVEHGKASDKSDETLNLVARNLVEITQMSKDHERRLNGLDGDIRDLRRKQ